MDLKKKLKRFFTLTRKANDGFTLVELIVVIAILAILAGVGSVGYAGYIKSANEKTDKTTVLNVMRALDTACYSGAVPFVVEGQYAKGLQVPVGYVVISNEPLSQTGTYTAIMSQGKVSNDGSNYSASDPGLNVAGNPIAAALTNAYGDGYANAIQLNSDNWVADAKATFFASAPTMVDRVDTMGTNVLWLLDEIGANNGTYSIMGQSFSIFSQGYENSADLMQTFANKLAAQDKESFLNKWENVATEDQEGFGFASNEREHYSAARAAYNSCFASYVNDPKNATVTVEDNTYTHDYATCASNINGYGESASTLISGKFNGFAGQLAGAAIDGALRYENRDINFPQTVCESTFATDGALECPACAALYKQYKDTGMDRVNGEAFYDTMATGAAEGGAILGENAENKDAYFNWMKANAETFADMSNQVNSLVGGNSAVIIEVYAKKGMLNYAVSPKSILE